MSQSVSLKPELFGKFILLDKIAMGGMAEVYRAKAPGADGIGKIIAIKRILPQYSTNAEFIEMFKNEAKIAVNLTQANVAQIYEFGEEQNQFYLAMEMIDGRNLRQILSRCSKQQKALTIEQCVFIMAQVAAGLDYAHRCTDKNSGLPLNIIHRDMSPQNIMISFEGEVKIVDFGIAKAESKIESTRAGTLKGKFGYMSPEQAEGYDLDARTDIFSTGIVLWELLTGERLFVANNELNTIRKIRECQIPSLRKINPHIHEELERITNRALARDRSLRYQTASELYKDLSRFLYKINPEFTSQDTSLFIKTIFKDEIIEDRKKVMEFSKIKFSDFSKLDDSTRTITYTETDNIAGLDVPKNLLLDKLSSSAPKDMNIKVDRAELIKKTQAEQSLKQGLSAQRNSYQYNSGLSYNSGSQLDQSTQFGGPSGSQFTGSYNQPYSTSSSIRTESAFSKWLPTLLLLGAVIVGSMAFLKNPTRFFDWGSRVLGLNAEMHETKQSSTATTLPETHPAEASETAESVSPKKMTPPQKATGYLDIETLPSSADIYIDGKKLNEKSPIRRYPVPANKSITVSAINTFSNTRADAVISVKQDAIKFIRLTPKKR